MKERVQKNIQALMTSSKIRKALEFCKNDHSQRIEEMKELALVQGETGKEHMARSPRYLSMISREGARDCAQDSIGNVYGHIYGAQGKGASPVVLFEAHLDTVFKEDTPLAIREEGGRIYCPGIGDDAAGLTLNLSVLRAIRQAELAPVGTLMVAGTACEEAQGNFRGMRQLFAEHPGIAASISIDGGGNDRICRQGVGVRRIEFIFRGPGGHSWMDYGLPACMHAMCRAMSAVAALDPSNDPKTTVNIGVISGGTSVGAIAAEARAHVDMRSLDAALLAALENDVLACARAAVATENAFRGRDGVTVEAVPYTDIPAAVSPLDGVAVLTAAAASEALRVPPNMTYTASTNANIPMSMGIPALTIGYGGVSTDIHSLNEWFDPTDAYLATQKTLLTVFALAGLQGVCEPLA